MGVFRDKLRIARQNSLKIVAKFFTGIIMVLLAFGGYGLGKIGYIRGEKEPIRILSSKEVSSADVSSRSVISTSTGLSEDDSIDKENVPALLPGELQNVDFEAIKKLKSGGIIIGTKSSKKYYFPWCGTVQRLKESNAVVFKSIEDARAAGFVPAKNCKGLE